MILVVDCKPHTVSIVCFQQSRGKLSRTEHTKDREEIRTEPALRAWVRSLTGRRVPEAIAFRIIFGGDSFPGPVRIDEEFFARFVKLTDLFAFYVPSTMEVLKKFHALFTDTPLIAFFDTSFFLQLPDAETYYALPFEYQQRGIKKWGFHGIFHEANAGVAPAGKKTISLVMEKQTTVCAVWNGKPFSISLAYTSLEGIMSRKSCGALDPGIVFYLMNVHNFSIYKIDEMLKEKSGFVGLTGYDIEVAQMLKLYGTDPKVTLAFDVYCAQILRHIGEGIAVLGGLDTIVVSGNNAEAFTPIIYRILKELSFLGVNVRPVPWKLAADTEIVTSDESEKTVYINRMPLPDIIFHKTQALLRQEASAGSRQ